MTLSTYCLGAPFFLAFRKACRESIYWLVSVVLIAVPVAVGSVGLAVLLASQFLLVGLFVEFDRPNVSWIKSAAMSLAVWLLILTGFGFGAVAFVGKSELTAFIEPTEKVFNEYWSKQGLSEPPLSFDELLVQAPSGICILGLVSLFLLLLLEPPLLRMLGQFLPSRKLLKFKLSDWVIWLFLLSLFGRFVGFGVEAIDNVLKNTFNVGFVLYSFQGIAVFASLLRYFRLSNLLRSVILVVAVLQFFVVLAAVGLADYWFDFRSRFGQKSANIKSQIFRKK